MPGFSAHKACDDFHVTARAVTRRQMVGRSVGAGLAVYMAANTPLLRIVEAAEAAGQASPNAPVLVSVFLPGGCDLLAALPPVAQEGLVAGKRRSMPAPPTIALPGESRLLAHSSLATGLNGGVAGLFGQGKIALLPGIDYANPDMSHFHSRHFWETGLITDKDSPGWLGRWLDRHGSRDNPLQGLSLRGGLSPVLRSSSAPVAAVNSPDGEQLYMTGVWGDNAKRATNSWVRLARHSSDRRPGPRAASTAVRLTASVSERLAPYQSRNGKPHPALTPSVVYPQKSRFADGLRDLAGLLAQPLGIRVATVDAPGNFDTHDNQPKTLETSLADVSGGLAAFQADLEARGIADRVLTFVWSEFGRRPESNDSQGTDHGAGGIAWVQGTRVRGGIHSEYPDLSKLDRHGNLAVTVDFRRVYASLIEQWLGTDASAVIPRAQAFGRIALVA